MTAGARPRDPRLDFFRGIGMLIIFTAHMPGNWLTLWIPARFGFSDATEIFVFCSGMASAIAFGRVFRERGWTMGTLRVSHRIWQVYWAHIGLFFAVAVSMVVLNRVTWVEDYDYVAYLNLTPFFAEPQALLPGLMTLTYVPNYFDILPMYLVILALLPFVLALHAVGGPLLALGAVAALWLATQFGLTGLPAEPFSDRVWFFNPFGWALIFFTGFGFAAGWIPAPPFRWWLVALAVAILLASVPFAYFRIHQNVEWLTLLRDEDGLFREFYTKTQFGILRYIHFLALAYLAFVAAGAGGLRLIGQGLWGRSVAVLMKVGQQSLAVFLMGMFSARLFGAAVDHIQDILSQGDPEAEIFWSMWVTMAAANILGWLLLIVTAYAVSWLKSKPWQAAAPVPRRATVP
ncbi:MAG: OpgC domain-containing protein [Pseudomonadota bacterium]